MDAINLHHTHLAHADQRDHADLVRVAHELRTALISIGAQAPGLDAPIAAMQHSFGSDGRTLFVHVELPEGISRVYSFAPGQPVSITDND